MTNPLEDDSLLEEIETHAVNMARDAGAILSKYFQTIGNGRESRASLGVEYKDEKQSDPVTNADKDAQEFLKKSIEERFPEHGVLGEEDDDKDDASPARDFMWVLDPLDGTRNFLHGLPIYASSIGVMYQGVPIVGAVFIPWPNPNGGVVLHARKGGGAFADDEPIAVSDSDEPKGNTLVTLPGSFGWLYRFDKPMRDKVGELRVTGSIAYEFAMTARGVLQYAVTTGPHLWDVAGGVIIVTEAGGLVMSGQRSSTGLDAILNTRRRWEPMTSLVPSWQSGKTTMKELRNWRATFVLGNPSVVRYVTSNMRAKWLLKFRLLRSLRRLMPRRKKKAQGH